MIKVHLHLWSVRGLFVQRRSVTFPFFLTHHLKAIRRCESSFTTENLAKINFLHLFLALVRKSKCDRLHSFCPPSSSSIVFLYLFWILNISDVYFWAHVHVLIACDVGGIYRPHMSRIICCCRLMCTHGHVPMCRMHVHTLTLYVRKLCGGVDVSLCEACVCVWHCVFMIAPVPWVTNSWQAACPAAGDGWVGDWLILSLALTSYRSPSILFSSCQNSQLRIDSSLLHFIFTRPHNKVRTKQLQAGWAFSSS